MKKKLMQLNAYSNKKISEKEIQKKGQTNSIYLSKQSLFRKKTKAGRNSFQNTCSYITRGRRHYWTLMRKKKNNFRYKKGKLRRKKRKYTQKEKGFGDDLNYFILQVNSGEIVCNEAKKKLCDDETQCPKKGFITKRQNFPCSL